MIDTSYIYTVEVKVTAFNAGANDSSTRTIATEQPIDFTAKHWREQIRFAGSELIGMIEKELPKEYK